MIRAVIGFLYLYRIDVTYLTENTCLIRDIELLSVSLPCIRCFVSLEDFWSTEGATIGYGRDVDC